jgi:hypothetical protein
MGSSILFCNNTSGVVPASVSRYVAVGVGPGYTTNTEITRQLAYRVAGTLSLFTLVVLTNDRGASTAVSRINGADGNQSLSIGASATGTFTDAVNTDTFSAGDLINIHISTGSGGTTISFWETSFRYHTVNETVTRCFTNRGFSVTPTATTLYYDGIAGDSEGATTTELNQAYKIKVAGTLKNLFVKLAANTLTGNLTVTGRINNANSAVTVTIGSGSTGNFEDSSNTAALAVDDVINLAATLASGSGSYTQNVAAISISSTKLGQVLRGQRSAGDVGTSVTRWAQFGWTSFITGTSESTYGTSAPIHFTGKAIGLHTTVSVNTITATSTLTTRKNGGAGNQSLSIGSSATGFFEDTTNADFIAYSDSYYVQLATGGSGTVISPRGAGVTVIYGWGPLLGQQRNRLTI